MIKTKAWFSSRVGCFYKVPQGPQQPRLDTEVRNMFNYVRETNDYYTIVITYQYCIDWSLSFRETSATTHVVLEQFKTCVILCEGFLLFGSNPGATSIRGEAYWNVILDISQLAIEAPISRNIVMVIYTAPVKIYAEHRKRWHPYGGVRELV